MFADSIYCAYVPFFLPLISLNIREKRVSIQKIFFDMFLLRTLRNACCVCGYLVIVNVMVLVLWPHWCHDPGCLIVIIVVVLWQPLHHVVPLIIVIVVIVISLIVPLVSIPVVIIVSSWHFPWVLHRCRHVDTRHGGGSGGVTIIIVLSLSLCPSLSSSSFLSPSSPSPLLSSCHCDTCHVCLIVVGAGMATLSSLQVWLS